MSEAKDAVSIFSSLQYYIAGKISSEAREILDKAGAKCNSYLSELVKVGITDTTENEEEYSEITDIYDIPVVSCDWVLMSHKCGKLLPTKAFPPKQASTLLFKDKVFSACHVEKRDLHTLWGMITFHGGTAQRKLSQRVTHLLSTTTLGRKYAHSQGLSHIVVVTPDWVVDCIKSKQIVSEAEYHPRQLIGSSAPRQSLPPNVPQPAPASSSAHKVTHTSTPSHPSYLSCTTSDGMTVPLPTSSYPPTSLPSHPPTSSLPSHPPTSSLPSHPPTIPMPSHPPTSALPSHPPTSTLPPQTTTPSQPPRPATTSLPPRAPTSTVPHRVAPPTSTRPSLHDFTSGFTPTMPGYLNDTRFSSQHQMMPPMMGSQQQPPHRHQPSQFVGANYITHGSYGISPNIAEHTHQPRHQTGRAGSRGFPKVGAPMSSNPNIATHSGTSDGMGYHSMHYTGTSSRQSPVSPSMMRHALPINPANQRSSPSNLGNRKTPPMLNIGHITEVPYPSQASLPEETPIIRMTNMAAFPMGSEVVSTPQRKSPVATGKTTPRSQSQSKSPVNSHPFSISVIKQAKSSGSVADSGSHTPTSADRSPASTASRLTPPVNGMKAASVTTGDTGDTPVVYYGYDSNEPVSTDMCLAGCIFYMGEYAKSESSEQWIKVIEENGGTVDPSYSNRVTHIMTENHGTGAWCLAMNDKKRVVTAHWLNDVIERRRMEPPWRAHHLPNPHIGDNLLCTDQVIGITGFNKEERRILRVLVQMLGASFTNYLASSNTALVCKRLEGEKVRKAKEWGIECVNVQWLSELVLGNLRALKLPIDIKYKVFERDDDFAIDQHNIAAAIMAGWTVPLKIPKDLCRKFKSSSKPTDTTYDNKRKADGDLFIHPSKRMRLQEIQNTQSNLPSGQIPCVLLTGFTHVEKAKYTEMIGVLGGVVCEDVKQCTHLIAEKVLRTPNFLLAVNYCTYISSSEWILESMRSGHFVDERVFTLQNTEAGSMWNILEALDKRNTHGKPFTGLLFHITPGVPLSTSLPRNFLSELIIAAGGRVQPANEKRWSAYKILENVKSSHNGKPTYIVVSCPDDIHLCMDILRCKQEIYSVEFILTGVMNQLAPYDAVLCLRDA